MDEEKAREHAGRWIAAWNAHDLDGIMRCYAPGVRFAAPSVTARWGKADGALEGTDALRRHFARGLALAPDLHFDLLDVLIGTDGVTILYRRESGVLVADVVVLDAHYRGVDARAYVGGIAGNVADRGYRSRNMDRGGETP